MPARAPVRALIGALLLGMPFAGPPAGAGEYTRYVPVVLPGPAPVSATLSLPAGWRPGSLPAGWRPGEATVVLLFDPADPPALRNSLMASLLAAQEAVIEAPYPSLPGALLALDEQGVSGPVVLLGLGDAAARAALGDDAALAGIVLARVGLGSGAAVFRTGRMSGLGPLAAPFCEALAWSGSAMPTPLPVLALSAGADALERDCRNTLSRRR
jgi:hypothetical protein